MPQVIPLTDDAAQEVTLLGFVFFFYWNIRDNSWRMSISQNDNILVQGIKLIVGIPLLSAYSLGIGDFLVIESSLNLTDPIRNSFVTGQFSLLYFLVGEEDALSSLS